MIQGFSCRVQRAAALNKRNKPRCEFSRSNRLLKRADFVRLSRMGRRIQNAEFILCYGPGQAGTVRLGVTVTRKVGGAVQRNRIKRLCREYFRCHKHRIVLTKDINLIAKRQAAGCDNEGIRRSLDNLFKYLIG
jgi:ribonuclease P protein component